jgi:hypothetical protein
MGNHSTPEGSPPRNRLWCAVSRHFLIAAIAAGTVSCQPRSAAHRAIRGEPTVQATVLTIETTIQPDNKTFVHSLVVAGDRARSGDEVDRWRLFDLHENSVTYVDDISRTYRRQSMTSILDELDAAMAQPLPEGIPRVSLVTTGTHRVIQGADATEVQLRAGSYTRQLWIGQHPLIPPRLFAMMVASEPSRSPLEPMMKSVNDILLSMEGFPLADHSELAFDTNKALVVDENVIRVERRSVPRSWLSVSTAYRDVTPAPPGPTTERRPAQRAH